MSDNTYANQVALVNAGGANIGETAVSTFAHRLVDVNGNQAGIQTPTALVDGATITCTLVLGQTFVGSCTIAGNRTLVLSGAGLVAGARFRLYITQSGSTRTLTLSVGGSTGITAHLSGPSGPGSSKFALSTTDTYVDIVDGVYDGTNVYSTVTTHIA